VVNPGDPGHLTGSHFGQLLIKFLRGLNFDFWDTLLGGGINIYALCLQSRNETVPVRLGDDNDSRTPGLEGNGDKASKCG
jgi:hypothetical protein